MCDFGGHFLSSESRLNLLQRNNLNKHIFLIKKSWIQYFNYYLLTKWFSIPKTTEFKCASNVDLFLSLHSTGTIHRFRAFNDINENCAKSNGFTTSFAATKRCILTKTTVTHVVDHMKMCALAIVTILYWSAEWVAQIHWHRFASKLDEWNSMHARRAFFNLYPLRHFIHKYLINKIAYHVSRYCYDLSLYAMCWCNLNGYFNHFSKFNGPHSIADLLCVCVLFFFNVNISI